MSQVVIANTTQFREVPALDTSGNVLKVERNIGQKLSVARYLYILGSPDARVQNVQIKFDTAFAGTITIETCCLPRKDATQNPGGVSDFDTTAGNWIQYNPTSGGPFIPTQTGLAVTNATITVTAGTGGGTAFDLTLAAPRVRLNVNATAGGAFLVCTHGKQ